ncbi:MAG: hypothetical protein DWQ01_16850 [Planctomycetota bacterium]|nr:MAG: hypothetical protein DWQ01_16850 [Planctomycetota bacterium]
MQARGGCCHQFLFCLEFVSDKTSWPFGWPLLAYPSARSKLPQRLPQYGLDLFKTNDGQTNWGPRPVDRIRSRNRDLQEK